MKTHARVVVIGGGIAGCSTLYHLTREGWTDVVLVERDELTSGSTWHAAAQVTQFGANQCMLALKRYSIELYRELAAHEDFPINYHLSGGMRLAHNQAQVDTYRHFTDIAKGVGVDFEYIDAVEAGKRHPLLQTDGLLGAWWDPLDGDIDPAQLCFALARHARRAGAEIYRFNAVEAITRTAKREFIVHTQHGDIACEMLVNASGYRVNEVGNLLGVTHPVVSMQHMYFLTEPIEALQQLPQRLPVIRDPGDNFYSRQEKNGLLVGVYEQACQTFGLDGIDPHFSKSLCPSDLDRCLTHLPGIIARLPCLATAGIHSVINGPITYSADGAPLVGAIPGIPNAYACLGLRAGIGEGGGLGKILAQIMVHGEAEWDAWYLDPRRFTHYATTELCVAKAIEEYQREFDYPLPHEQRSAGRLARCTPLYPLLEPHCAWGVVGGWERALFFKPAADFVDTPGYRFTPSHDIVAREVAELTQGVGVMEVSGFNRYALRGRGARAFLDHLLCGQMPRSIGEVKLGYLLTECGNVLSEATIAMLDEEHYWYGSAAAAEWHDRDWLQKYRPRDVSLTEMTTSHTTLVVAGPHARALLQTVSPRGDWSAAAFPPLQARTRHIGQAQVLAMRVSYSGELAYELHVANEQLYFVWQQLHRAPAKAFDLTPFGLYAAESMRLEKGYRHWKADLIYEYNPIESGLAPFVKLAKPDFIGKAGLLAQLARGDTKRFVSMLVECPIATAHSGAPVYYDDHPIGSVTSAGYGHRIQKNIAMAFVDPAHSTIGTALLVGILGERYPARVVAACLYDQQNRRARG